MLSLTKDLCFCSFPRRLCHSHVLVSGNDTPTYPVPRPSRCAIKMRGAVHACWSHKRVNVFHFLIPIACVSNPSKERCGALWTCDKRSLQYELRYNALFHAVYIIIIIIHNYWEIEVHFFFHTNKLNNNQRYHIIVAISSVGCMCS